MTLSDLIRPEGVMLDVEVADKAALLEMLSDRAAQLWPLDRDKVLAKLIRREKLGSTGVGNGIALPHGPCAGLEAPALLFARLKPPIDFQSVDDRPVDLVLMLLLPKDNPAQHLSVLSMAARVLRQEDVAKALRHCDAEAVPGLIQRGAVAADEELRDGP
ncbi:PTS sugar transporter subunit IIA [Falsirhodobacter algicola]|uniref:PTS transporter subunit EIIA n=1 Tax=Falsirhodobacter algicola TaxID=2692330 RepID=A0A8J8MUF2_9RHOB|nr:PTS sugar transporter subunit IIA [Falsirhodobacter algicola]QUS36606.1 PTS transporter subunit EIIA [Falsirhodobacter algicola]